MAAGSVWVEIILDDLPAGPDGTAENHAEDHAQDHYSCYANPNVAYYVELFIEEVSNRSQTVLGVLLSILLRAENWVWGGPTTAVQNSVVHS